MNAVYQASFNKYLHNRGIKDTTQQHVWAFLGDGEMDEPESRGFLQVAAQEELDNLTFVVNCNLQRLDGPVRGNGKIIQELEAQFRGAGWNVIKVVWGRDWDPLLAADRDNALVNLMNITPDGDYQTFRAEDGAYIREHFFGRDPRTLKLVEKLSDDDIWWNLKRGGHDYRKVYAAYRAAIEHNGQPTVILAKTIKVMAGYALRRPQRHPPDEEAHAGRPEGVPRRAADPDQRRPARGGQVPPAVLPPGRERRDPAVHQGPSPQARWRGAAAPALGRHAEAAGRQGLRGRQQGSGKQQVATTMAFVRILRDLMRDKDFGPRVVPIIPDEARTFGMDSFFPTAKIYNPHGQQYTSVDRELMLAYTESVSGQILHVGINEAGSVGAFQAAGTAYATHGEPMVPVYVFYSMFGFQRTGDSLWAAADQMTRGFLIGATAGRTTLTGEGLQHADGHSPLLASTNPAAVIYDPAYGYEIGHIMKDGLRRMYGETPEDVFYYLTVYNEPIVQPPAPENVDVEGILKGIYKLRPAGPANGPKAQILASGVSVPWALEAQNLLANDWGVAADVWSVTSWIERCD